MEQYRLEAQEVLAKLGSGEAGLSAREAGLRLAKYGRNALQQGKKRSKLRFFFAQFKDLMSLILIAAALLSGVLAFVTGDTNELADTAILLFIILLNAVVGFLQQYRADDALQKLKKMSVCRARVVRGGRVELVDAEELVVGDVVEVEEGDKIPADCRILTASELRTDESALTGESVPVKKGACVIAGRALSARKNTLFASTFCVKGRARCVVVATGMGTEMGKIAGMLRGEKPKPTPLDKTLTKLGKIISATVLTVAAVLFLGGLLARRVGFLDNVMSAVAVAVAAIPEGMGAVVTIILAMGVQRMAKARAVMRRLSAVETLGGVSCICSDKTGTLTRNKMTVQGISTCPCEEGERYTGTPVQQQLLRCMRVCNTVTGSAGRYAGDPTEVALVEYADGCGYSYETSVAGGTPFSSERRMMSVLGGDGTLYVKGAVEAVLARCTLLHTSQENCTLTQQMRRQIVQRAAHFEGQAMRVLAFATGRGAREEELAFVGLAAMLDPPKAGAREAVLTCRRAGIRTVMITGDSRETAFAIAQRLGIARRREEVVTGEELDEMGQAQFAARAGEFSVYARVSPSHKKAIVDAIKAGGEVVAMTGDGVNDAPSIKAADIGVAMGSGTDVTKDAADMVITDDDFSTMVHAVEEGRNVFYNVKKTISFFLATNLAEVLSVLIATLFLWKYDFLTSTQLLWINLITDSLPVLALGVERTRGAMLRPPVSERDIFSRRAIVKMLAYGAVQAGIVVGLFTFGVRAWGNGVASTMAFLALSLIELFHAFNVKREGASPSLREFFSNRTLLVTVVAGVLVNVLLVLLPPLRACFDLSALTGVHLLIVLVASFAILPIGEGLRLFARLMRAVRGRRRRIPLRGSGV